MAAGGVVIGHRLGLYRALAEGPATPDQLAERAQCSPRYVAEWLRGQAAGGYVDVRPIERHYSLSEEQAFALTDPDGPVYLPGAFVLALGALKAEPHITEAFRTGKGFGWHEQDEESSTAASCSSGPATWPTSCPSWIPALDGVEEKLRAGGRVADIGAGTAPRPCCSRRRIRVDRLRLRLPRGVDRLARKRAAEAGVADRVTFEVGVGADLLGLGYDLVATFDCLHDMGDPLGAARHIREASRRTAPG